MVAYRESTRRCANVEIEGGDRLLGAQLLAACVRVFFAQRCVAMFGSLVANASAGSFRMSHSRFARNFFYSLHFVCFVLDATHRLSHLLRYGVAGLFVYISCGHVPQAKAPSGPSYSVVLRIVSGLAGRSFPTCNM